MQPHRPGQLEILRDKCSQRGLFPPSPAYSRSAAAAAAAAGAPHIVLDCVLRGPDRDLGVELFAAVRVGDAQPAVVAVRPLRVGPQLRKVHGLALVAPCRQVGRKVKGRDSCGNVTTGNNNENSMREERDQASADCFRQGRWWESRKVGRLRTSLRVSDASFSFRVCPQSERDKMRTANAVRSSFL